MKDRLKTVLSILTFLVALAVYAWACPVIIGGDAEPKPGAGKVQP